MSEYGHCTQCGTPLPDPWTAECRHRRACEARQMLRAGVAFNEAARHAQGLDAEPDELDDELAEQVAVIRDREGVLSALRIACAAHPTQRVAQVLVNATMSDPFHVEDLDAIAKLLAYAERPSE